MTIRLPEDLQGFIRLQVQSGRFATEEEAVAEAVRRVRQWEEGPAPAPPDRTPVPAWQRVLDNMEDVPDDVLDRIPEDSSAQLDHHLYGTPRRPNP